MNTNLTQTEMRISPQLKRFVKLSAEIDVLLDSAENFGHSLTTDMRYHQARSSIAEFELRMCRRNLSNERISGYLVLTDYLKEQTKKRYQAISEAQK